MKNRKKGMKEKKKIPPVEKENKDSEGGGRKGSYTLVKMEKMGRIGQGGEEKRNDQSKSSSFDEGDRTKKDPKISGTSAEKRKKTVQRVAGRENNALGPRGKKTLEKEKGNRPGPAIWETKKNCKELKNWR